MVKVLVITTGHLNFEGITAVIMNYYRNIDMSQVKMDFVASNPSEKKFIDEIRKRGSGLFLLPQRSKHLLIYILKLLIIMNKGNYDIVHVHGNSATMVFELKCAQLRKIPNRIAHVHNSVCKYKTISVVCKKMFANTYTHAFACGELAGKVLYGEKKFHVIKNGFDVLQYRYNAAIRQQIRNRLNLNGKKVVGHVGSFTYQKNHEYIIDVLSELYQFDSSFHLILIGDGIMKDSVTNETIRRGLIENITFIKKTDKVYQYLMAMDYFIFPSRYEGLPMAVLEAQATGLPCFLSNAISQEVKVGSDTLFLELKESAKKWAECILNYEIIDRGSISDNNIRQLQEKGFDIRKSAQELQNIYLSLCR